MKYSVVVPCYNEQEVIELFLERITKVMQSLEEGYELIFVDDGSKDATLALLRQHAAEDKHVKILAFSRNFGHQAAITAGMKYAMGDAVVIIDSDLQDPPEVIPRMVEKWKQGYQIVYGKRKKRKKESVFKRVTAFFYYRILHLVSGMDIPRDTGDFRLLDKSAVLVLNSMSEQHRYLRGLNTWVGMRQYAVEYDRDPRAAGKTKYSMKKMVRLASDGLIGFSSAPLNAVFTTGVILNLLGVLGGVAGLVCFLSGVTVTTLAWLSALMTLLSGLVLFGVGIVGVYVGRIFDEVRNRPLYIIQDRVNFN